VERHIGVSSVARQLILLASLVSCGGNADSSDAPRGPTGGVQVRGTGGASTTTARGGATVVGVGGTTGGNTGLVGSAGIGVRNDWIDQPIAWCIFPGSCSHLGGQTDWV